MQPSNVRENLPRGINVKAVFATLAGALALVGAASVVIVASQVRAIRAEQRSNAVRDLRAAR